MEKLQVKYQNVGAYFKLVHFSQLHSSAQFVASLVSGGGEQVCTVGTVLQLLAITKERVVKPLPTKTTDLLHISLCPFSKEASNEG